jgi:hypothetical protein
MKSEIQSSHLSETLYKSVITLLLAVIILTFPACQPSKEAAKPPVRLGPGVEELAVEILASLEEPVILELTLGGDEESMAEETTALVDLIESKSSNVTVKRFDLSTHYEPAELGVTHGPIVEMKGKAPGRLRYYGFPERKETRPFLEGILSASGQPANLASEVKSYLAGIEEEVWIRIFTTPD